jgi:hypothetical protein
VKIRLTESEKATKKSLVGRTIARVNLHPFDPNREGSRAIEQHCTNPIIIFDDGSTLEFDVQETEVGKYGISVIHKKAQ